MAGLYVHIPFCRKKCSYFDFYSIEKAGHLIKMTSYQNA